MFHSLYTRHQESLEPKGNKEETPREWPATYLDGIANVDPQTWELEITGDVAEPKKFSLEELKKFPRLTQNRRLVSAQGWTYRSEWEGFLLQSLVDQIKPAASATILRQVNLLGQVESIPLGVALQNRAPLCYGEAKKPLTALYGGPLRLMVFDRYAYKGMAQLARLEFVPPTGELESHWAQKGYPRDGQIAAGQYYAFDTKKARPIHGSGEVTSY